jgi:hypothetical protein
VLSSPRIDSRELVRLINNALGNFELLVICGLCKFSPQCKPIHINP